MKHQRTTHAAGTTQEGKDLGIVLRHLRRTHRITKDELALLLQTERHVILRRERGGVGLMTLEELAATATSFDLTLAEFTSVALRSTAGRRGNTEEFHTRVFLTNELLMFPERAVAHAHTETSRRLSAVTGYETRPSPPPEKHHWCYAMRAPQNHRFEPRELAPSLFVRQAPPSAPPPKGLDYAALGRTLYLLRRHARISRTEIGRVFGIQSRAIERIERGRNTDSTWQRIPTFCAIYHTTIADVLAADHGELVRRFGDHPRAAGSLVTATDIPGIARRIAYVMQTSGLTRRGFRVRADICKQALQNALGPSVGVSRLTTILRITTSSGLSLGDLCSDDCQRAVEESWPIERFRAQRTRRNTLQALPIPHLTAIQDWLERERGLVPLR